MKKIGRNAPCPCRSGKKYKRCCLGRPRGIKKPAIPAFPRNFIPVYTDLDKLSNSVVDLVRENKLDEAEKVCRRLLDEYPDQVDGISRLAYVYEARGERKMAVEHYLQAAQFAETHEGFDHVMIDWYRSEAKRIEAEEKKEKTRWNKMSSFLRFKKTK